jgi:hypothetical protein
MLKYLVFAVILLADLSTATPVFSGDIPAVKFIGAIDLQHDDPRVGGLSGLTVSADGKTFTAISDRGSFVTGALIREGRAISEVRITQISTMKKPAHLQDNRPKMDTEGLAIDPNGRIAVSLEGPAEVWIFDAPDAIPHVLPSHPDFANMPDNGALEALAITSDGALLTIAEEGVAGTTSTKIYRYNGENWTVLSEIDAWKNSLPVAADIGPDGKLYLLHREFSVLSGFRSSLSRYSITSSGFGPSEHLWHSKPREHGNLEGLSVWRDAMGDLRFTMVSDDNFHALFRSELVEYALTE